MPRRKKAAESKSKKRVIYATDSDWERLRAAARQRGTIVSEFVRDLCVADHIGPAVTFRNAKCDEADTRLSARLRAQLDQLEFAGILGLLGEAEDSDVEPDQERRW